MRYALGALTGITVTIYLHHSRWVQHALWWTFTTDQRPKRTTTRNGATNTARV